MKIWAVLNERKRKREWEKKDGEGNGRARKRRRKWKKKSQREKRETLSFLKEVNESGEAISHGSRGERAADEDADVHRRHSPHGDQASE